MFRNALLLVCFLLAPLVAGAKDGIRFDVQVLKDGAIIASPSVWTAFGQPVVLELPGLVKFEASAAEPDGSKSRVSARFYYHDGESWVMSWDPVMAADLSKTPSFE